MSIIFCGAEGEWALFDNTLDPIGADSIRRGSVLVVAGDELFRAFTGTADMWFHFRFASTDPDGNTGSDKDFVQIRNSSGEDIVAFQYQHPGTFSESVWRFQFGVAGSDGGAVVLEPELYESGELVFEEYDVRIRVSTVTDPDDTLTVDFYKNGQFRLSKVVTDSSGWNLPAQLRLRSKADQPLNSLDHTHYQDIIVADGTPTIGMELAIITPNAVGNYSDFTNDYTNIDEVGYDSLDAISTLTIGDKESWTFDAPSFTLGNKSIYGVAIAAVAQTDVGALVNDFRPFVRISATDYEGAAYGADNVSLDHYVHTFTQNPSTLQPWNLSDITGLEVGIEAT